MPAEALTGPNPIVEMRGIRKSFSGVEVLKGIDMVLNQGEFHGLVGENGAGKSTLVSILGGVIPADAGQILIRGREVAVRTPGRARNLGISIVHQNASLVPHLSVAENIFLGQEVTRGAVPFMDWRRIATRSEELCAEVGLNCNVRRPVGTLSFVERQLVAIARALLLSDMRILILDEPTACMDSPAIARLFDVLLRLKQKGLTAIYVSHRLNEVFELTDRITVLRDGVRVGTVKTGETSTEELVGMMIGRTLAERFERKRAEIGATVLKVNGLSRHPFFTDVSFEVRRGEVFGIFGTVGAGKTELLRCIYGADEYEKGQVFLEGSPLGRVSPRAAIRKGIFLVPEDRRGQGIVPDMSLRENLMLAAPRKCMRAGIFINHAEERNNALSLVQNLRIKASGLSQPVKYLSGGNQQKVVLGKGIYTDSKVYMFDEPTRGIDVGAKAEIYRLMGMLAARGAAIILSTSELPEAMGVCDTIGVMHRGKLVRVVPRGEATEEMILSLALTGRA